MVGEFINGEWELLVTDAFGFNDLGELVSWSFGLGLAGIFMFFGMLQFWFAGPIFGNIGKRPEERSETEIVIPEGDKLNPFSMLDKIMIGAFALLSVVLY